MHSLNNSQFPVTMYQGTFHFPVLGLTWPHVLHKQLVNFDPTYNYTCTIGFGGARHLFQPASVWIWT